MILDKDNLFSNAQAITASVISTNVIDLGSPNVGRGTDLDITAHVVEAFNNLTSLQLVLQSDDNEAFSSPRSVLTGEATTLAGGGLAAGGSLSMGRVPPVAERYVRLSYVVVGTAPTTGKVTAGLIAGRK